MSCLIKNATEEHKISSNKSGKDVSIFGRSPENVTPGFPLPLFVIISVNRN
jgi:hypothetical protein